MCGIMAGYKHVINEVVIIHILLPKFDSTLTRDHMAELEFILELVDIKYKVECTSDNFKSSSATSSNESHTVLTYIPCGQIFE